MSEAVPQPQAVSEPAPAPPQVGTEGSISPPPVPAPKAPSIGMVMLEWALNVVVGFLLIGTIAAVATYFMMGPNDKQLAVPLGIFLGITLGAVIGSKTKIIRIAK